MANEFNDVNSVLRIGKPFLFFLEGYTDAKQDPGNKLWEQNEHNTSNSVLWIGK